MTNFIDDILYDEPEQAETPVEPTPQTPGLSSAIDEILAAPSEVAEVSPVQTVDSPPVGSPSIDTVSGAFDAIQERRQDSIKEPDEVREVDAWESFKRSTVHLEEHIAGGVDVIREKLSVQNNPLLAVGMAAAAHDPVTRLIAPEPTQTVIGYDNKVQELTALSAGIRAHAHQRMESIEPPVELKLPGETMWDVVADPTRSFDYIVQSVAENSAPTAAAALLSAGTGGGSLLLGATGRQAVNIAGTTAFTYATVVEGGASYNELVAMGVPDHQAADTAAIVGLVNGLLETLPWAETIKNVPAVKKLLYKQIGNDLVTNPQLMKQAWNILKIASLEGVTEGLQEIIGNAGKRVYNDNQSLFEGVDEAAFLGFLLGGKYSTITETAVEIGYHAGNLRKKFGTQHHELTLESAAQQIEKARAALEAEATRLQDAVAESLAEPAGKPEVDIGELGEIETMTPVSQETVQPLLDRAYENTLVRNSQDEYVTLESVDPQPGRVYKGAFGLAEHTRLKELEAAIAEIGEIEELTANQQEQLDKLTAEVSTLSGTLSELPLLQHGIANTIGNWVQTYMPEYAAVVGEGQAWNAARGVANTTPIEVQGRVFTDFSRKMVYLDINRIRGELVQPNGQINLSRLLSTLAHEFGHMLTNHYYQQAPKRVQQALWNEYQKWRVTTENTALRDVDTAFGDPGQANFVRTSREALIEAQLAEVTDPQTKAMMEDMLLNTPVKEWVDKSLMSTENLEYYLSFPEWLAQEMAREKGVRPKGSARMFDKVRKALARFHKRHGDLFAPTTVFETWVSTLARNVTLNDTVQRLDNITPMNATLADEEVLRQQDYEAQDERYADFWGTALEMQDAHKWVEGGDFDLQQAAKELNKYRTDMNRFKRYMLTIEQIGYRNQHIHGLKARQRNGDLGFIDLLQSYNTTIREYEVRADETLKIWRELGTEQGAALSDFALEANRISHNMGRKMSPQELVLLSERMPTPLSQETFEFYQELQAEFESNLTAMEEALSAQAERTINAETLEGMAQLDQTLERIKRQTQQARSRNYFPASRFGNHTVLVRAKGAQSWENRDYKDEAVVVFETYETKKDAEKRAKQLGREFPRKDFATSTGILDRHERDYVGLPLPLLESMRELVAGNKEKEVALEQAIRKSLPGQGFAKRFAGFKDIKGASKDGARSYATYTSAFGHYLSKVQHADRFDTAIGDVQRSIRDLEMNNVDTAARKHLIARMQWQRDYVLNPRFEWQFLSALSFTWYLGAVPMKIILNLLQIPTVVVPYLSHRYGAAQTSAALTMASPMMIKMHRHPEQVPAHYHAAMERLAVEGVTTQSMFFEIAGVESGGPFGAILPTSEVLSTQMARNTFRRLMVVSGWLWNKTENWARYTTALATYDMEIKKGSSPDTAYQAAKEAVKLSMFEYARWNRPPFMTGHLRPITIFFTHIQHMLEHFFGPHPEKYRTLAMIFLIAGFQGLPFMEDTQELLTAFFRFVNKRYGREVFPHDATEAIREQIHSVINEIVDDPHGMWTDAFMRGGSRYSFGLGELGRQAYETSVDWAGVTPPEWLKHLPNIDLHSSVSLGRIIPGIDAINATDFNSMVQRGTTSIAGAGFGIPLNIMKAYHDTSATDLHRLRTMAPAFLSHPMKAYEYLTTQEAVDPKGNHLVRFDLENQTHVAEALAQALGGNVSRVNIAKEANWAFKASRAYWQERRNSFYRLFANAVLEGDKAMIEDARKRIVRWNKTAPVEQRITNKSLQQAAKNRIEARLRARQGLPPEDKEILLKRRTNRLFPLENQSPALDSPQP